MMYYDPDHHSELLKEHQRLTALVFRHEQKQHRQIQYKNTGGWK